MSLNASSRTGEAILKNGVTSVVNKFSVKSLLAICVVVVSLTGCDREETMGQKVAFINMEEVLTQSPVGRQEMERNAKVKAVLLQAENQAKDAYQAMSEAQQQKSRTADATVLNRQWVAEQNHARAQSVTAITNAVEAYRKSHNIAVVVDSRSLIAAAKENDISKDIISQLKEVKVDYGRLPEISVKKAAEKSPAPAEAEK